MGNWKGKKNMMLVEGAQKTSLFFFDLLDPIPLLVPILLLHLLLLPLLSHTHNLFLPPPPFKFSHAHTHTKK